MKLSEKKTLKKKEQILMTAIAIVNKRGYDGATMEDIAAELLMTKGSLYYYFKNKGDLMYGCHKFVLSDAMSELEKALHGGGTAEEILRRMISTHIDYAVEKKEVNNLITEPSRFFSEEQIGPVLQLRKQYASFFDRVIDKGITTGEFHVKEPVFVRMIILGAMNWMQQWYRPEGRMTLEQLKENFGDYIIKLLK